MPSSKCIWLSVNGGVFLPCSFHVILADLRGVDNLIGFMITKHSAFRERNDESMCISEPIEAEELNPCFVSTGWLFWDIMSHLFL